MRWSIFLSFLKHRWIQTGLFAFCAQRHLLYYIVLCIILSSILFCSTLEPHFVLENNAVEEDWLLCEKYFLSVEVKSSCLVNRFFMLPNSPVFLSTFFSPSFLYICKSNEDFSLNLTLLKVLVLFIFMAHKNSLSIF